jgi:hypothetical protein
MKFKDNYNGELHVCLLFNSYAFFILTQYIIKR